MKKFFSLFLVLAMIVLAGNAFAKTEVFEKEMEALGFEEDRAPMSTGGPDEYGYTWIDSDESGGPSYSWIDASSGTDVSGLGDDNVVGPFEIGFEFPYYWYGVTEFYVGSNGYIAFHDNGLIAHQGTPAFPYFPTEDPPNNVLGPWVDDLTFIDLYGNPYSNAHVYVMTNNQDQCVISFVNARKWAQSGPAGSITFQIVLTINENGQGEILYQYDTLNEVGDEYKSVGMEDITGTIGLQYYHYLEGGSEPHNDLAVLYAPPDSSDLEVHDVTVKWAMNEDNGGSARLTNLEVPLQAMIKNTGNQDETDMELICTVTGDEGVAFLEVMPIESLAAGEELLVTMDGTWFTEYEDTYSVEFNLQLNNQDDWVPSNNVKVVEIQVINYPGVLTFADEEPEQFMAWNGTNSGYGIEFVPPNYPCEITGVSFFATGDGSDMLVKIMDDDGANGSPGTELFSQNVNVTTQQEYFVELDQSVFINDGHFFVGLIQQGEGDPSTGIDQTPPISYRGWEFTGSWSPSRDKHTSDPAIGVNVTGDYDAGTIAGTVTDSETGDAIAGATVETEVSGLVYSDTTDTDGNYTISGVPVGERNVFCNAMGYRTGVAYEQEVILNETLTLDFALVPGTNLATPRNLFAMSGQDGQVPLDWQEPMEGDVELYYDDGTFENCLYASELGPHSGVRFSPGQAVTLTTAKFYAYNYATPTDPVNIYVYDDAGGLPGTEIAGPFPAQAGGPDEWVEVDLGSIAVGPGDFFITTEYTTIDGPCVGADTDEPYNQRTVWGSPSDGWSYLADFGDPYDTFDMSHRAVVTTGGGRTIELTGDNPSVEHRAISEVPTPEEAGIATCGCDSKVYAGVPENRNRALTGYKIYRDTSSDVVPTDDYLVEQVDSETLEYVDMTVENDVRYYYIVTALYDDGESFPSNEVSALPEELPDGMIYYDDGSAEAWFTAAGGLSDDEMFAVQFSPSDIGISAPYDVIGGWMKVSQTTPIDILLCPVKANGDPDINNPYEVLEDVGAEHSFDWSEFEFSTSVYTTGDFFIVARWNENAGGPGIGTDENEPDGRSYWTSDGGSSWTGADSDWMIRAIIQAGEPADVMVIDYDNGDVLHSGKAVEEHVTDALQEIGLSFVVSSQDPDISTLPLDDYPVIFLCLGYFGGANEEIDDNGLSSLTSYLADGGRMYLQGPDFGYDYWENGSQIAQDFYSLFGITYDDRGAFYMVGNVDTMDGMGILDGIMVDYKYKKVDDSFVDEISTDGASMILMDQDGKYRGGCYDPGWGYKTVYTSTFLGGAYGDSTQIAMLQNIYDYLTDQLEDKVDGQEITDVPQATRLEQNYPNPFNPTTSIKFSLKKSSDVALKIYNSAGQLVKTLVDGKKEADYYDVQWNGVDEVGKPVSSGIYFYRLETDDFSQTKSMILLK